MPQNRTADEPESTEMIRAHSNTAPGLATTGMVILYGGTGSDRRRRFDDLLAEAVKQFAMVVAIEESPQRPLPGVIHLPKRKSWQVAIVEASKMDPDVIAVNEIEGEGLAKALTMMMLAGHSVLAMTSLGTGRDVRALLEGAYQPVSDFMQFVRLVNCSSQLAH